MTRPASTSLRTRRARLLSAAAAGALTSALVWASPASAAPGTATVQTGTATVGVSPTNSKETDVTQTSQRAFIDWTSFNLSADEIVAFKQALGASSITFNRVSSDAGLTTIAGQITAPGAVWLFTPAGLIVGPTAKINVGALVASTGEVTPNFGFGPSGAGTFAPLSDNAVPIFGATAAIQVQSGAQITASSGFVVLNSQQVTQNGQVTATDAVSFDLADNSTINFTTGNTTGAVQQLGTVNVSGADSANASLTHGGTSKGAWVQVAAPDEGSDDSGFAGVINMSGVVQATGVAPAGTAQNSVLLVGADAVAGPIEGGNRSFSLKAGSGTMTADSGGIYFTGSDAALGTASAKGAVNIAVDNALTLGATSVLRADSSGVGSNALTIQAGSIVANASSVIAAGPVSGAPPSDVTINTDQGMTLGVVKGGDVELQANGGDIDLLGPTTASVLLNVQAPTGSVLVEANVSSQGSITINAGDTISASAGVTLQSNLNGLPKGGITLTAFDLNLDPTSSLLAGPDMAHLVGDVDAHGDNSASVGKIAGAFVDVTSSGNITLGGDITATDRVEVDGGASEGIAFANNVTVSPGVQVVSDGAIDIDANNTITVGPGVLLQSGAGGEAGYTSVIADDLEMDPTSSVIAGKDVAHLTGSVTLEGDTTAKVGKAAGSGITVINADGDVTLAGDLTATGNISVSVNQFGEGNSVFPDTVTVKDGVQIVAGNAVDIESYSTITVGNAVLVQSNAGGANGETGSVTLSTDDLEMDPTSSIIAGPDLTHLAGDVTLEGDSTAMIGAAAGGSVTVVSFEGDVTLGGNVTATGDVTVSATFGEGGAIYPDTITVSDGVHVVAGGGIDLESNTLITIGDGAVLQSTAGGNGENIYLESFSVDAAPTSLLAAGPLAGPGTGGVTVWADGGDLKVGSIVGTRVYLEADGPISQGGDCSDCLFQGFGAQDAGGGSVYVEGTVKATGEFDAYSDFADVHADGAITAGGAVNLSAAGDLYVGAGATIIGDTSGAGSQMQLTAGGKVDMDATSVLQNGASPTAPTGDVTVEADGGDITTGAISGVNVELSTAGAVTVGGAIYGSTSVIIDPADVTLNASVTSGGGLDITADNSITLGDGVTVSAADHLNLTATTIGAGKGVTLQSDSDGDGNGDLTLVMQSVTGAPTLIAGKDATHPSAAITADASAGGLDLGGVTGNLVSLTGEAGDVTLAGPSTTGAFLTITAIGGKVGLNGNIAGGGTVDVTADDAITLGAGVTISAADHLNLTATTITAGSGATLQSDSDGDGNGDLTLVMQSVSGGVSLIAGKDATHPSAAITADASAGGLDLGGVTGDVVSLTGEAGDVTLAGASTTGTSLTIRAVGGNIGLSGNVTGSGTIDLTADKAITVGAGAVVAAGDHLQATAASISLGAGGGVASDADQDGVGALSLHALTGDIVAGAGSLVNGGAAAVTVTSDAGAVTLSSASGSNLTITAFKAVTLNGALTATGQIDASGQSIAVNGGMTALGIELDGTDAITVAANQTLKAGSSASLYGGAITLGAKSVVQGDAAGAGGGVLLGGSSISADASSQLLAGSSPTKLAGDISVFAAGDVILGQALGGQVTVSSSGDVTLAGAVQGVSGVSVDPGNLTIDATVSSGGAIYLATSGGVLTVGSGVAITSTGGQVELFSDGDLSLGANASVTGVSLLAQSNGVLHLASGASLVTTGQEAAPAWPVVSAPLTGGGEGPPVVSGLVIVASGLDLQGSITAGQAGARDDVYIVATGQPQQVVVGGADSASGFHLSNAAIGRITARNLVVMAGFGNGDGADIAVQDLTLNTAQLGALALGTDSSHVIDVTGAVALQGTGSTDLHLGFALQTTTGGPTNNPDAPNGGAQTSRVGYVPGEIDISGSLGLAASPFHAAVLLARDDIFMGSADFITAAKADATFDAGKSSSAYAIDTGHVFLASHDLELAAEGRIIQQNTGGSLQFAGLVFDAPTSGHELVANPTSLNGQALQENDDGWTPNYATGPTRVDVFGLVTKADGTIVGSVDAAQVGNLSAPAIADVSHYKINTCVFATQCLTTPPPRIEVPTDEIIQAQAAADSSSASSTQTPTSFAQTIQIDDTSDDDKSANGAPVTGSGNGDLWTGPSTTAH